MTNHVSVTHLYILLVKCLLRHFAHFFLDSLFNAKLLLINWHLGFLFCTLHTIPDILLECFGFVNITRAKNNTTS